VADYWKNSPVGKSRYCKKFYLVPRLEKEDHVDGILDVCQRKSIDVVLPVQHDEVLALSERKQDFVQEGIGLPIPSHSLLEKAVDKFWVSELAQKNDLAGPRTFLLEQIMRPDFKQEELTFPLVVKLRRGTGQEGQKKVGSLEALESYASIIEPEYSESEVIVQEFIPGSDCNSMYTVGLLYDDCHRLKVCVPLKKIRSRPYTGGTAICTQAENKPELAELAIGLMETIGNWEGIADVEIKLDPRDGIPKLIELNPRPWGSIYGAYAAGVDLPWLWTKVALHQEVAMIDSFREKIPASFLARDLQLLADLVEGLFSYDRREVWKVLRTYLYPYLFLKHRKAGITGTSDFVLRDLRPFLANLNRIKGDLLPGIRRITKKNLSKGKA